MVLSWAIVNVWAAASKLRWKILSTVTTQYQAQPREPLWAAQSLGSIGLPLGQAQGAQTHKRANTNTRQLDAKFSSLTS